MSSGRSEGAHIDESQHDPLTVRPGLPGGGPKAVLADAAYASRLDAAATTRAAAERAHALRRICFGGAVEAPSLPAVPAGSELDSRDERRASDGDSHEDGEEDDGDFLARFRAQRLAQLRVASTMPSYGGVEEVTAAFDFTDAVDGADRRALVVTLLHEDFVPECRPARAALAAFAAAHVHVRCLSARSSVLSASFDVVALPALLLYRGGALLDSLLRIHEAPGVEGRVGVTDADLERMLAPFLSGAGGGSVDG
jgi:hypothetical protein